MMSSPKTKALMSMIRLLGEATAAKEVDELQQIISKTIEALVQELNLLRQERDFSQTVTKTEELISIGDTVMKNWLSKTPDAMTEKELVAEIKVLEKTLFSESATANDAGRLNDLRLALQTIRLAKRNFGL